MFYFQTNTLGFTPEFLGKVRLAGALASLAGVGAYNFALKDVPLRKMFLWTAVVGTGLGMTQVLLITGAPPFPWLRACRGLYCAKLGFSLRLCTLKLLVLTPYIMRHVSCKWFFVANLGTAC